MYCKSIEYFKHFQKHSIWYIPLYLMLYLFVYLTHYEEWWSAGAMEPVKELGRLTLLKGGICFQMESFQFQILGKSSTNLAIPQIWGSPFAKSIHLLELHFFSMPSIRSQRAEKISTIQLADDTLEVIIEMLNIIVFRTRLCDPDEGARFWALLTC